MVRYRSILCCTAAGMSLFGAAFDASADEPTRTSSVEEIVVTAQRRSEALKDVPLSVTAVSGGDLAAAGVTNNIDLPMVTPGLKIDALGIFIQPAIRGITTTIAGASSEANVATYVDGVYQQSMQSSIYDLPDVQQIEVLKGPQGTLFGRNATGGAILIKTFTPDMAKATGRASISYGSYNEVVAKGYLSVPIVDDRLAASITALVHHDDGWKHDLLKGGARTGADFDDYLVRAKLRFIPWQGADFVLTGAWAKRNDNNALKLSNYLGNNIDRSIDPAAPVASQPYQFSSDIPQIANKVQKSLSLHGDIVLGPGTLSTTTAYDRNDLYARIDADNGPVPLGRIDNPAYSRNIEQELLYTTNQLGRFRAVGGVFYYSMLAKAVLNLNNFTQAIYFNDKDQTYAAFGTLTYDLSDRLSLTGGLRYTHEARQAYAAAALATPITPAVPELGSHSWDYVTPSASLLYKVTDHTNVYFNYSKGTKSGIYNTVGFQTTPVDPESVNAYEVGFKSTAFNRISVNAAAFLYNYNNLQVNTVTQQGLQLFQTVSNAATARIYGGELSGKWYVSDNFDVTFGGTYLHAHYIKFPNAIVNVPSGVGGNLTLPMDVSGNTMIRAPKFSANLTAAYHRDTRFGIFDASSTLAYSTKVFEEFGNRISQPAVALLNATIGWQQVGGNLRVSLWGKNLTDKAVISALGVTALYDAIDYTPPRTVGVEVSYGF